MDITDLTVVSRMRRADELARVLDCKFEKPGAFPETSNVLVYGGFYEDLVLAQRLIEYSVNQNIYVLFTGVDICELQDAAIGNRTYYYALLEIFKAVKVLTLGRKAEDELKYLGVEPVASVVLPVEVDCEPDRDRKTLITYVPEGGFYGYIYRIPVLKRLAEVVDLVTYGARGGWFNDTSDIYRKALLNIRITRHDGQPHDLIAMAQMGIQSIVSYCDLPYMVGVANSESDDVMYGMTLTAIKNYQPDAGEIDEMKTYYRKRYSAENSRRSFERV